MVHKHAKESSKLKFPGKKETSSDILFHHVGDINDKCLEHLSTTRQTPNLKIKK